MLALTRRNSWEKSALSVPALLTEEVPVDWRLGAIHLGHERNEDMERGVAVLEVVDLAVEAHGRVQAAAAARVGVNLWGRHSERGLTEF
jgi:hypothetical protein